jgi:hypothetical protein
MANVIRAQFQGKDGRLNIDKGILTFYGGDKPVKWDITKRETTELLREFLNSALVADKRPTEFLIHITPNNNFHWASGEVTGPVLARRRRGSPKWEALNPNTNHTKAILSAMVRANVE